MARERWRNVRRAPGYQVSDLGRVRGVARTLSDGRRCGGGLLAQHEDADGYLRVTIRRRPELVHVLVLEAFRGPRPAGMEGCHGPGGKRDNSASNLRWDTHRANERDKRSFGLTRTVRSGSVGMKGERNEEKDRIGRVASPHLAVVTAVSCELADG